MALALIRTDYKKNSLFVRNLSQDVSEALLREIFEPFDAIEQITFRSFNTTTLQFFAQIDFHSSKGVIEGTSMTGVNILGVPCVCGVIDPMSQPKLGESEFSSMPLDQQAIEAEFKKRQQEAEDDQVFRTVHVAGFGLDMPYDAIREVCSGFGEVEQLRIDRDENKQPFALCEFKERGPAHVCKLQQQYLVRGTVLRFMEAKTMVDACTFAERTVQFEDPGLNAIAMRSVLQHPGQLSEKIKLVRAAAEEILPSTLKSGDWTTNAKESKDKKAKKEKRSKGEYRERREKQADGEQGEKDQEGDGGEVTKEKGRERKQRRRERRRRRRADGEEIQANGKPGSPGNEARLRRRSSWDQKSKEPGAKSEEEHRRGKRRRRHRKSGEERSRHRRRRKSDEDKSGSHAECLSSESDGPIDLDEVQVVENTELVVMGSSSSSSSSSTGTSRGGFPACSQDDDRAIDLDSSGIVSLDEGAAGADPAAPDSPSSSLS